MAQLDKRLLEACKEAIADFESKKFSSLYSAFSQMLQKAQETGDKDLEPLAKLLMGIFSMYFKFAKGQPFGPLVTWKNGRRTLLPEDLQENELSMLEEIVQVSNNAEFLARIYDVLWIRRKNHLYAQKAVKAYLQSVDEDKNESWVSRKDWLKRATQIAMELGNKAQERQIVKQKILDLFQESRKTRFNKEQDYYWPSSLLELLIENKLVDNWEEFAEKAVEIAKRFSVSPRCKAPRRYYELAAKCYQYANKPEKVKEMKLTIAKLWEDEAMSFKTPSRCDALNLADRLEKAIQAYREAGEKKKAEELVHELKEANKLSLSQMESISFTINGEDLIKIADDLLKEKTGIEAIEAFSALHKPLSYEQEKKSAEKNLKEHPLYKLCDTKILTEEGNVSAKISGIPDDYDDALKSEIIRGYNIAQDLVAATTLKRGISLILQSGDSWKEAIKEIVSNSKFVPSDRVDIYDRAIIAGFEGDFLLFVHLIIPQIENSVRLIFDLNKLKVTSVLSDGVQEERDLNQLLVDPDAERIFGKDLVWEMRSLLTEKCGPNLRNRVCHGLANLNEIKSNSSIFLLWLTLFLIFSFKRS